MRTRWAAETAAHENAQAHRGGERLTVPHVLIAGGGVAALEGALALRALLAEPVDVELLGPEPHFWYRPLSVAEPFGLGEARRYDLGLLAGEAGARFTHGELLGVDATAHTAQTSVGAVPYDMLLVAIGARPVAAVPGAETFRGPADTDLVRWLLSDAAAGQVRRLAFVVPVGTTWTLPAYELALLTATHLREQEVEGVELVLVTPEEEPLQLFGREGSDAIRRLLEEHEIELVPFAFATEFADGALTLSPGWRIPCTRVVALPRLRGARLDGLAQTLDGFLPIDDHARVLGLEDVYAAGDITSFPVKQGGIATQLADAAAQAIAARLGADVVPQPFHPVLRGMLLTGSTPRYLRHSLAGGAESRVVGSELLWWPPGKIVGRYLSPFLAGLGGHEDPAAAPAEPGAVQIEVELTERELEPPLSPRPEEPIGETVEAAMSADLLVIAPEDTLGEVAERMRGIDTGCAAVVHYGRLIGILTARDLLQAVAARVHPSEARAREWMTADPVTVSVSAGLEQAIAAMDARAIHHLPVVDGERPVGMLGYRQAASRIRATAVGLGF